MAMQYELTEIGNVPSSIRLYPYDYEYIVPKAVVTVSNICQTFYFARCAPPVTVSSYYHPTPSTSFNFQNWVSDPYSPNQFTCYNSGAGIRLANEGSCFNYNQCNGKIKAQATVCGVTKSQDLAVYF